jgi:hypothetical protein
MILQLTPLQCWDYICAPPCTVLSDFSFEIYGFLLLIYFSGKASHFAYVVSDHGPLPLSLKCLELQACAS